MRRISLLMTATVLAVATPLLAHTALRSSSPARDAVLDSSPTELRLTFTEPIEPRLARLQLLTADSIDVPLGDAERGDSAQVLVAAVPTTLAPGTYTVVWQVIGRDGHPVRGRFVFTVTAPSEAIDTVPAPPAAQPGNGLPGEPVTPLPPPQEVGEGTSVTSAEYVAVRWLTYAALMVAIGAITFRFLVLGGLQRSAAIAADAMVAPATSRAGAMGRGALVFLILAAVARLIVQTAAIEMPLSDMGMMRTMLLGTTWGWGWLLQVGAAAVGIAAFHRTRRGSGDGWVLAVPVAVLLALGTALSGHAAAVDRFTTLAVLADTVHILAVAAWLGTLLFVIGVGLPEARRADAATSPAAIAAMVAIFSPAALVFAGIAAGTGVISATFQLGTLPALWTTGYGRTLLVKLAFVALVVGAGAYNWRRVRPRLAADADAGRLRTSAGVELAGAAIVLLITAVLVAMPTP